MKTELFKNSIISQAIELGFDFNQFSDDVTVEEINEIMLDFFHENSDRLPELEDECEVQGGGNQNVVYGDYQCSGEIVDFSAHWHKSPDTKVYHSDFVMEDVDGLMKNMRLYYLVGETDYNAPEGFWYNPKTGRHEEENF